MRFCSFSKQALILLIPAILILIVAKLTIFQQGFYEEKFSQYGVEEKVKDPILLHQKVMDFIQVRSYSLPDDFNEREKSHFSDVRKVIGRLTMALYFLVAMTAVIIIASINSLKKAKTSKFIADVLVFGGIFTIAVSFILFFMISSNFASFFESFHKILFEEGTYLFDPSNDVVVRLYPANLFMDLGLEISKNVIIVSTAMIFIGSWKLYKIPQQLKT